MTGEAPAPHLPGERTGMADAVLREIVSLLEAFSRTGAEAAIDLGTIPLTAADRDELEHRLGRGEIEAKVAVAGDSEVWETAYSGVWWVRHRGLSGRVACEHIAITAVPDILASDREDARAAAQRLAQLLATSEDTPEERQQAAHG